MTPTPVFTAEGKFYSSLETNELLPSVSTVLSTCYPNYGAIAWRKKEIAAGRDPNRHATRGTVLHAIAEQYLKRNCFSAETQRYTDPEFEPWIEPLLNGLWAATNQLGAATATETYVEAPWYAGTMDALLESGTVLDMKTVQSLEGWRGDESAWFNAAAAERRAWLQVLGYCNAADLASEDCSGVTGGALLIVSPEAFLLKTVRFEMSELDWWCELTPVDEPRFNLCEKYRTVLAQRQRRQAEVGERGDIASAFGLTKD